MGDRTSGSRGAGVGNVGVGAGTRDNVTMRGGARLDSRDFTSREAMNERTRQLQQLDRLVTRSGNRAGSNFNPNATRGVRRRFGR